MSHRFVARRQMGFGILVAGLVVLAGCVAPAAVPQKQAAPYLKPRPVRIEAGRTINLVCVGHGAPTVVLTAGLGNWSLAWRLVQGPLAALTRVCAWDRAGYGFSSPSPEPQDIVHTTRDLEKALQKAGIHGPYVMVGHSLGAYETLRFTDLHPRNVIGMVLVDPAIPDQQALMGTLSPLFKTRTRALDGGIAKQLEDCAAGLRNGTLEHGNPQFERCTVDPAVSDSGLKAAIAQLNTDPARFATQASTVKEFDPGEDSREVINAERRYGNMPLVVLTAGGDVSALLKMFSAGTPAEVAQLREQVTRFFQDAWGPAHDAYAALSTRGRNQLVPDSPHPIQIWKPEVVISAVTEVIEEARRSAHCRGRECAGHELPVAE